ncbi:putative CONSERVED TRANSMEMBRANE PROTEIN [Serinicoccus hydrothermalis]|uniref:Putative CONSERVED TRANSMEMBRANE PROTEIN n=1 Tax=Serinicoccus hydrothermalis TaxID=1758689 RepID=A0A1B1N8R2_9MICO|nr:hypothetical protein [Serinicoccus hydrothermalis]ANS77820.1 putative CONSERVED TRANSMEMBRANE PROTEIN [Serinicoccus hydrothermalis]
MHWYADAPARRTRQIAADLFVLGWVVLWVLIGRWVFGLVLTLAAPAVPLRSAGTGMQTRMNDVAGRVTEIPLVGDSLQAPFTGAAGVGTDLVSAGDRLEGAVRTVAWVVTLISAGTPILVVVLAWAVLRLLWVRRAHSLTGELSDPESLELLALRALVHQHPRRLQALFEDPVAAWRTRDPDTMRALADLELAEVGLRSRA